MNLREPQSKRQLSTDRKAYPSDVSDEEWALVAPYLFVVGGGFGGLYAAHGLARAPGAITVVDKHNYHLFRPMLYQVATRLLVTLRWAISFVTKRRGVRILPLAQAEITRADPGRQSGLRTSDEE
jgi:NADH dehydrogenase